MARTKMTDEAKLAKKAEKEQLEKEKQTQIQLFKDCDYINTLSDEIILKFLKTCKEEYPDLETEDVVSLMFKKFANKEFAFTKKFIYE